MLLNISLSNLVFPDIIFDILITPSSKIKFLGIIVSCNLSQSDHVFKNMTKTDTHIFENQFSTINHSSFFTITTNFLIYNYPRFHSNLSPRLLSTY